MRRLSIHLLASGLAASTLLLLPGLAFAGPPSLPEGGEEAPGEVADPASDAGGDAAADDGQLLTADGQPMPTDTQPAGPGEEVIDDGSGADASAEAEGGGELETAFEADSDSALDSSFTSDSETAGAADTSGEVSMGSMGLEGDSGPGMVAGRREPVMNSLRGPVGLYYTSLADVGDKYTVRFRLHTDFFVKNNFFCCEGGTEGDRHARLRGAVNLGFTFTEWTEVYFNVNSSSNRNTRDQGAREDPPSVFALGDMNFGIKGAYRFLNGGLGLGGQVGLGLLAGSEKLRTSRVNFDFAVILGADLRYLTKKEVPVRITGNIGWTLDNSPKLIDDWSAIEDPLSREVLRFSSGVNHSRVNTKIAVDFPIRLGKDKQYGIDPIIEYNWDIATYQEEAFVELTEEFGGSPLKRSQAWLTLGARANVYSGLFLDLAVDVGTTSPSYEFGPPVPPYQVILGLGWSIDPRPRVKQVPVAIDDSSATPEPVLEGRILGRVADLEGNAIAGAKVSFPGLASNVILTDAAGMFTSFRFPEGPVSIDVELPDGTIVTQTADVRVGEDAQVDIIADVAADAGEDVVFDGTFLGKDGVGVPVKVALDGMGIQETFDSDGEGRIAIALPLGDYKATVTAEGYEPKEISFSVVADTGAVINESLVPTDAAGGGGGGGEVIETPLISGNKYRIRVKKGPRYSGNDLNVERSAEALDQLASYLNQHPEYGLIEIRVHTDDRGNPKKRSQSRADAIAAYLVGKGVVASRIKASGWGDKDPVAVNITADGRRKNNRTEFKVKDYDESKKPASGGN
ncbi:putative lipoprotein YiaD precursor [Enhygromyxa salina]|uniref:Putative lipoprotein YiaD n=1 Tax=Enhygromyxa salina TaxID=215803 RepID=A0A2S9YLD9_9BACT|nr:OmpA family protein [Enhygromyxa salina]PRQ05894.1 putative lipoprotein YiaD precursor [Enhygromyxa salina]